MKRYEEVFQTNTMPDHPPTTTKIWLGIFSGCLISIIAVPLLIIAVMSIADSLDSLNQFWLGVVVFGIPLCYFGYLRFKRMIRP